MYEVTIYFSEGGATTIPIKARNAMVAKSQAKAWARTYEPSSTVRKVEAVRR